MGVTSYGTAISILSFAITPLYSLAETAKANGLKPYEYFKYALDGMLQHMDDDPADYIDTLMPWSEQLPENIREYKF